MIKEVVTRLWVVFLVFAIPNSGCWNGETNPADVLEESALLIEQGKAAQAIELLEEFEQRQPGNVQILEQLGFAYATAGDHTMAALTFSTVAEIPPGEPQYLLYAAQSLIEAGDRPGAIDLYQRYLQERPENAGAWRALGNLALSADRSDMALNAYIQSYERRPSPAVALELGNLYLRQSNMPQAQGWYRTAASGGDDVRPQALLGILEIALRESRFVDAEGMVANLQREYPGAIEESRLAQAPQQLREWRARQREAQLAAEALANRQREEQRRLQEEARQREIEGQEQAQLQNESLVQTTPAPDEVATEIEGPHRISKEEALARIEAEIAAEAPAPPPLPTTLELAREAKELGNLEEAARLYRSTLAQGPTVSLWIEYAETALQMDDKDTALSAALEARRLDPESLETSLQYLNIMQEAMRAEDFHHELIKMRRQFPGSSDIALALARSYWRIAGNARYARMLYLEFLERAPGHPQAQQARREMNQLPLE